MKKLKFEDIDPNFKAAELGDTEIDFYDVCNKPFAIYGLYLPKQNSFNRMPTDVAETVSDGVAVLHKQTSGGRIRFKTNSSNIVVKCVLPEIHLMKHMPLTGSSFFDLYLDGEYFYTFLPSIDFHDIVSAEKKAKDGIYSIIKLKTAEFREIEINFPLYNAVSEVYVGVDKGSEVLEGKKYIDKLPIVYYGSSITQGGCAGHPGNAYQNIISRRLNCDFINLGFSGRCKAENEMCDYISSLDMSIFIYDYDHNANNPEYLQNTHESFFKRFRRAKPDVPVIFVTCPDKSYGEEIVEIRKKIIYTTYKNAIDSGDKNVYFIDGQTMFKEVGYSYCTVDNCHPNDLGFWCMANTIEDVIKKII